MNPSGFALQLFRIMIIIFSILAGQQRPIDVVPEVLVGKLCHQQLGGSMS
jgi:hypothetical protein